MDLSDLTFGDKLSLKGKLFELQKKLKLIGIQKDLEYDPEATFQPVLEAGNYVVADREADFISNVQRAEAIRKQKLDMMKSTLSREHTESCTFSPVIATKGKYTPKEKGPQEEEPYFDKKLRKAKEAEDQTKALANMKKINPQSEKILRERGRIPPGAKGPKKSIEGALESKKMNEKSVELIDQRFKRDMHMVFSFLDSECMKHICFDDIRSAVLQFPVPRNHEVNTPGSAEFIWGLLDPSSKGLISFAEFLERCKLCREKAVKDSKSVFRDFISNMVQVLRQKGSEENEPDHIHRDKPNFTPKIGDRSLKLATKVKEKDLHRVVAELKGSDSEAEIPHEELSVQDIKLSAYEHMLLRKKVARDKIASRLKVVEDKELKECTFKPVLVATFKPSKKVGIDGYDSQLEEAAEDEDDNGTIISKRSSVFERLYHVKVPKDITSSTVDLDSLTQSELHECTFQPVLPEYKQDHLICKKLPIGFNEFVERARDVRINKEKTQEEKEDALFSFDDQRYQRVKEAAASGPQPFNFQISKSGIRRPRIPRYSVKLI